jgi:thymidylate kinase
MAAADPERWLVVDAMLPKIEVERTIWEVVSEVLKKEGGLSE